MDAETRQNSLLRSNLKMYYYYFYSRSVGDGYTGLDLGADIDKPVTKICFMQFFVCRHMVGGKFQGSNVSRDSGYEDLYTIKEIPYNGWNVVYLNNKKVYRYIRYLAPPNKNCIMGRIKYFTVNSEGLVERLTGAPFGTPSLQGAPADDYRVPYREDFPLITYREAAKKAGLSFMVLLDQSYDSLFTHYHDFYELVYIKKGSCFHIFDREVSHLNSGDFVFIPPGKCHSFLGGTNIELINIIFYPEDLPKEIKEAIGRLTGFKVFFSDNPAFCINSKPFYIFHLPPPKRNEILDLIMSMRRDFLSNFPGSQLSLLGQFLRLVYELSCHFNNMDETSPERNQQPDKAEKSTAIIEYIRENYAGINNVKELASRFNMSYRRLAEVFLEGTGLTLIDQINRTKIAQACQKILEGRETMTKIAFEVGFNSYSNFMRLFKKYIGCPPLKLAYLLGIFTDN